MIMEMINIAELLRDCPQGMELDCTMYKDVTFAYIDENNGLYPIICRTKTTNGSYKVHTFTKHGCYNTEMYSKCVIFPKGKTTWEGFHRPFEPGDIVITDNNEHAFIYSGENDQFQECYCGVYCGTRDICINSKQWSDKKHNIRLATEEEKEKLFQVIKDNGYEWNSESKILEKLVEPRFHIGTWVVFNNQPKKGSIYQIKNTHNYEYTLQHILGGSMPVPFSQANMLRLWTINDAKDGDVLVDKYNNIGIFQECEGMCWNSYIYLGHDGKLRGFSIGGSHEQTDTHPATKEQRDLLFQKIKEAGYKWNNETKTLKKLIQSKFNITTLKPFDKVLVRDDNKRPWDITFYECYDNKNESYHYRTLGGMIYKQCIPYENNEHLAGNVKDCSDYYKTWM